MPAWIIVRWKIINQRLSTTDRVDLYNRHSTKSYKAEQLVDTKLHQTTRKLCDTKVFNYVHKSASQPCLRRLKTNGGEKKLNLVKNLSVGHEILIVPRICFSESSGEGINWLRVNYSSTAGSPWGQLGTALHQGGVQKKCKGKKWTFMLDSCLVRPEIVRTGGLPGTTDDRLSSHVNNL